ncbi:hypothetical protein ACPCSD_10050 [Streptomyces griseoincarnatus]
MTQITAIPSKTATAPAAFEPLGGIISGDGLHTNEDIARTRRYLTVEQAEHMAAVADQRAEDTAREHTEPAGTCPVYRDCIETGPHDQHFNHNLRVHSDGGELLADGGMVADEDGPVAYLHREDFHDAASLHAATAKVRQMLDQLDAMADRVFTDHQARD